MSNKSKRKAERKALIKSVNQELKLEISVKIHDYFAINYKTVKMELW